jgi:hypothetical protein
MSKYKQLARRLFDERWFPEDVEGYDFTIEYFEDLDILALVDRRQCDRRDREWKGFRNYLYGWECEILAEHSAPDYAVMLINRSRDIIDRLRREFFYLTTRPNSIDDFGNADEIRSNPQNLEICQLQCAVEKAHSIWGRVAVENGKPIGIYNDNRELVLQPVDKHWTELH